MTKISIRNSTAEFLIFTSQSGENSIDIRVEDENIWLTQKLIAKLFDVSVATINEHLKNIFLNWELEKKSVIRNFLITANDWKNYNTKHYNLETIISVWYKINSNKAVEFRKWATRILKEFSLKWYVLDNERLKNWALLTKKYFDDLILEIRDIRESERNFYQKITDIYSTSIDYDLNSWITKDFFANVQNKMHFAVHQKTAWELIIDRANHKKDNMWLTNWKKAPKWKILKSDVVIAKNYLSEEEVKSLNRIVVMYLDYAEDQAENWIPLTMNDWVEKLNVFLKFNNKEILEWFWKVKSEIAKSFAKSEFEKYKIIQDKKYISDFDKIILDIPNNL